MTLFLGVDPLWLNPKDTVMNYVEWWDLVFPFCAVVIHYICLGIVRVAVEESLQFCSFYSLRNKSLELVKGTLK